MWIGSVYTALFKVRTIESQSLPIYSYSGVFWFSVTEKMKIQVYGLEFKNFG